MDTAKMIIRIIDRFQPVYDLLINHNFNLL